MNDSEKPKSSWRERRQTIKHKWLVPFIFAEWHCERVSSLLGQWAFFDILEQVGRLTILIAVIVYFMEADERRIARHNQAWQVISSAVGKSGNLGRMDALRVLAKDKVSLAGIELSNAFLRGLDIENAVLPDANFFGAVLSDADLSGAQLWDVNLFGANLFGTNLSGANLFRANLARTNLQQSNLSHIKEWQEIRSIELANIDGVKNPPDGFIEWAKEHGAVSIKDTEEWKKLLREKSQEKTKVK